MILRQLFDHETYTYLIADEQFGEALFIDPVLERMPCYRRLLVELGFNLKYALDTHVHADHVTALGTLRDEFGCETLVDQHAGVECASRALQGGEELKMGSLVFTALYTPGHTSDSICIHLLDGGEDYLFTGDTLFIRGTGRTDFQNGDAGALYDSIQRLLCSYPESTWVYPGHDYKGWTISTLGEEKANNPRLQVADKEEFIALMEVLDLPSPKQMDVAVSANRACGKIEPNPY